MARPITWRSIAAPNFDNSPLNSAINAFRSSGQGADAFTDQMLRFDDREREQLTNQEIALALRTGAINPMLNPRADSASVYDALNAQRLNTSNLETAALERVRTRLLNEETQQDIRYRPDQEARAERTTAAEESRIRQEEARIRLANSREQREQSEFDRGIREREQVDRYDTLAGQYRQGMYQSHLARLQREFPDRDPSDLANEAASLADADTSRAYQEQRFIQALGGTIPARVRGQTQLGLQDAAAETEARRRSAELFDRGLDAQAEQADLLTTARTDPRAIGIAPDGSLRLIKPSTEKLTAGGMREIMRDLSYDPNSSESWFKADDLEGELKTRFNDVTNSLSRSAARQLAQNVVNTARDNKEKLNTKEFVKRFLKEANGFRNTYTAYLDQVEGKNVDNLTPDERLRRGLGESRSSGNASDANVITPDDWTKALSRVDRAREDDIPLSEILRTLESR